MDRPSRRQAATRPPAARASAATQPHKWPLPADKAAAERLVERFAEAVPGHDVPATLLRGLGGNSPYLADLAVREPATLVSVLADGPDAVVARALANLGGVPPEAPYKRVAAALRQAKRVVALATAVADIGAMWRLEQVTAALSDLAEATLGLAVAHLLRTAHEAREITLPHPADPARASGFIVLGMGKLGARELNYSSDIDLILLHDPAAGIYRGDAPVACFSRIARALVALMEAHDADGYVFRTDLRLRPDPAATPPCMALPAAIAYYESMGQNWERAAMLKARPVAGDLGAGVGFLEAIRPFVWRRHLDFAAVADIHAMKRRIDAHKGTGIGQHGEPLARVAGHNVKLGEGGIREIEFLAQTLQLVWGGRDPDLRDPRTLEALRLLVRAGHVPRRAAADLEAAYRYLRQVEHRLQMVADRQTHSLPEGPAALGAFALFMGYADGKSFAAEMLRHLRRVQARYHDVFGAVPEPPVEVGTLDFSGTGEPPPATATALSGMGYADPHAVFGIVQSWQSGRLRALRSERARDLMRHLLPALLRAFARHHHPDSALARFDAFLSSLPAGVQLLSLFQRNPVLLERIAAVLGAAPMLADHLARTPAALEGLLAPEEEVEPAKLLRTRLADARALEDAIAIVRRTVREAQFSISVATLEGRMDADAAGLARSALADAALGALLDRVLADFAERFGAVRGGGLVVVLLGKAGGREMMAGSDLDLMLVYDHPASATESRGARPMAASQWFIRAVHAFIAAVTAPDASGPMYAVDMRLRPSGNKGPVAVSLAAFRRYHTTQEGGAWTWERMALTRARVVAGPPALRRRVEVAIGEAIATAGPAEKIRADVASMRARLMRELPPKAAWDVKQRAGGMVEVEFIAQALQLLHVPAHPEAASPTTREAFSGLGLAGELRHDDAKLLILADRVWRTVQGMLRLTEGPVPRDALSDASAAALLAATQAAGVVAVDVAGLRAKLDELAHQVRAAFTRLVGEIEA
jgi:[glutamine synthetase] adenylyltransferase / [glutamine synthetase]-adenylyl-L-tyrosine phosphorylase